MDKQAVKALKRSTIRDAEGTEVGKVADVYLDDDTGAVQWVTVRTGKHGKKESFVPAGSADLADDVLTVTVTAAQIEAAPVIDPDGNLTERHEDEVYRHYDLERGAAPGLDVAATGSAEGSRAAAGDDNAMTRSEERLTVGTEQRETGRVRLRKYVDTEVEEVDVKVSREKVRVAREPITDDNRDLAESGPAFTEAEHEVTLLEERPVVTKEAVPVERVRLDKETVEETETIVEDVRKERIEIEGDGEIVGR